ncbi:serine kinase [Planktothrix mougeotii]|uniref:Serine kinase n=1 Tax=Planktothrix mougeotii LEGE 06226 TaxID=1828728 RepID=A0ABR9UF56_9CYAN|nr:serine kinase [Planktothrix mougeotii]MBE9145100.1 serine kinase [Planktothrix mougeotii LEGE 06226]
MVTNTFENPDHSAQTAQKDSLDFFNTVYELYEKAEVSAGGCIDRFYCIGGFKIRLRFAGEALIPYMTPALGHLETEPFCDQALTVCLWDSTSTNTIMPPPPWQRNQHHPKRGEIYGFNSDRIHTSFQWGAYALSLLDSDRNLGIYWVETTEQIPYWEKGSPLRTILNVWMSKRGIQLVHGGAVGLPSGGVLLVGKGGSGKSTTALTCLNSELFYASDDYSLISPEPTPTVFSIYNTGKKNADDVDRLPFLATAISNCDRLSDEKALYFINEHFPEKILTKSPIRAVLIPRITGKTDTSLTATSAAAALTSLVPSTMIQLPGSGKEACQIMMQVLQKVPAYYLELGTDLEQIPQVIFNLITKQ